MTRRNSACVRDDVVGDSITPAKHPCLGQSAWLQCALPRNQLVEHVLTLRNTFLCVLLIAHASVQDKEKHFAGDGTIGSGLQEHEQTLRSFEMIRDVELNSGCKNDQRSQDPKARGWTWSCSSSSILAFCSRPFFSLVFFGRGNLSLFFR